MTFDEVAEARYVLLTTFTKDGRPKPTPVWVARDGDRLLVISEEKAWKVKRIRNTPRVTLTPCDMRGKPQGDSVDAVAAILDKSETDRVYDAIARRYGILGKVFRLISKVRRGQERNIGLALSRLD